MTGSEYKTVDKSTMTKLTIASLPSDIPDLNSVDSTKDNIIAAWLQNWIKNDLSTGKISTGNLLPQKADIAKYLGVSIGTVQNAIRYIEDNGYVESKQRIGTMVKDLNSSDAQVRKQTSKRDRVIASIKKLIVDNNYKIDEALPSSREFSKMLGSTANTTRLALEHLSALGVVESKNSRGNKSNWILRQKPQIDSATEEVSGDISSDTLVDQVERDLKNYITKNFKVNDKMPTHFELADVLHVSIKTVHDGMKRLIEQKILKARRGRYGTVITRMPDSEVSPEDMMFAPASDAVFYNYERVEKHLKMLIKTNYKVGQKLPSMDELSKELDVSSNTIRKALQNLEKEHIVEFSRGRYGGTFITRIPEEKESAKYSWVSVNHEHIKAYKTPSV